MTNKASGLFAVITMVAMSSVTSADPRKDKFDERLATMNHQCGSKITATYDLKSEVGGREPGTGYEYCQSVLDGVADACKDEDAKAIVVAKLKTVSCKMDAQSSKKMHEVSEKTRVLKFLDISFANGTLSAVYDFNTANIDSETAEFVGIQLGIVDAKALKQNQQTFAKAITEANEKCGSKFTATYDISSELTAERPPGRDLGNGYTYCVNVLEGVANVCSDDAKKPLVAKKLKAVTCKMEHGSSKKMHELYLKTKIVKFLEVSFKGGVLSTVFDWNTANVGDEAADLLRSKL
jgi:hypothetical protein